VFFFLPEDAPKESLQQRSKLKSDTVRWIFDPKAKTNSRVKPAKGFGISGEFSRIDDKVRNEEVRPFLVVTD
jgi:carotenoid cleavage dioxygenase